MIKTIAETIKWYAMERIKNGEKFQNEVSAIHATNVEIGLELNRIMKEIRK